MKNKKDDLKKLIKSIFLLNSALCVEILSKIDNFDDAKINKLILFFSNAKKEENLLLKEAINNDKEFLVKIKDRFSVNVYKKYKNIEKTKKKQEIAKVEEEIDDLITNL